MHRLTSFCLLGLGLLGGASILRAQTADLQFFGDVLITAKSLHETHSSSLNPNVFAASRELLATADHNIANLEGVITGVLPPSEAKTFYLRMPANTAEILRAAGIDAVTLANNHTMDFGFAGLLSTMNALSRAGIAYTGAGINADAASSPLLIPVKQTTVCILAFSKTLPSGFWATAHRPGTAFASYDRVQMQVEACARAGFFTVVAFHWGHEGHAEPLEYQRTLAHAAIDAGANLVLGHHLHIVQDIEVYAGRPIFYSLGNFAFASEPTDGQQEGLAIRLSFQPQPNPPTIEIVPLAVHTQDVHFQPRPIVEAMAAPLASHLPKGVACPWRAGAWVCGF